MVDFDYYTNTYLGSAIPETAFEGAIQQASRALSRFKRLYQVTAPRDGEKLALCAMAERIHAENCRPRDAVSTTLGHVKVQYSQKRRSLERELYDQARLYLDIYRGVSGC